MEKKNFEAFKKNIENFDNILNLFFEKKQITIYNYYPKEYYKLKYALRLNFKELVCILNKNENLVEIFEYMKEKEKISKSLLEICSNSLKFDILFLKDEHYTNLMRYLESEKAIKNLEKIIGNFFCNFDYDIFEYFRKKRRIFDEKDL